MKLGPRVFLIGALVAIWVPVVGWLLVPVFLLEAAATWISELIPGGKVMYYCRNCKKVFYQ